MLGTTDSLKIVLTATENGKAKQPHQAFLLLKELDTGLEATFPLLVKETGKGKVDFVSRMSGTRKTGTNGAEAQKDLPFQLLTSSKPLRAELLLASFGKTQGLSSHVFNLDVRSDSNAPAAKYDKPLRYGKLPEIHHIFKIDAKSGPVIISIFFVLAVLATIPVLLGSVSSLALQSGTFFNLTIIVGISRSQHLPPPKGDGRSPNLSQLVLRLNNINGRHLLPVLLQLDLVSSTTSSRCSGARSFLEWNQGFV